jgi:hypothetical protein
MRRIAIVLFLASIALARPLYAQQEIQLLVPLTTEDGKRPTNISASNLGVAEEGKLLKVLKVEPRDSPVRVTLMLENSHLLSDASGLAQIRAGAKAFLTTLPEGVPVALMTTAPVARTMVKSTMDRAALVKGIDAISPDSGPGRFIESMVDWVRSADKDKEKGSYTPVLVTVGSTYGDEKLNEDDVKDAMNKLAPLGAKVHAILYNAKTNAGGAAEAQINIGESATQRTGGKWELVANTQRIEAALPELGAEVAKLSVGGQYLVTVQRPAGSPARLGGIALDVPAGVTVGRISLVPSKK